MIPVVRGCCETVAADLLASLARPVCADQRWQADSALKLVWSWPLEDIDIVSLSFKALLHNQ